MSKLKPLNTRGLNSMKSKRFTFERDDLLILVAALYVLEEHLERNGSIGERAHNVFEIDGYGYPTTDEVEALRERINGL